MGIKPPKVDAAEKSGSITRQIAKSFERKVREWEVKGTGNLEVLVQDTLTETVTGAKTIEVENGGIGVRVGGKFDLNVTGSAIRHVTKNMGYSAKETTVDIVGGAKFADRCTERQGEVQRQPRHSDQEVMRREPEERDAARKDLRQ